MVLESKKQHIRELLIRWNPAAKRIPYFIETGVIVDIIVTEDDVYLCQNGTDGRITDPKAEEWLFALIQSELTSLLDGKEGP